MSLDITIQQKGLFKKKLTLDDILMNQFQYGRYDDNYILIPEEQGPEDLTLFHPQHIARGINVIWNENETKEIKLNMLFPTTNKEIDDLYQLIRHYCQCYKTDVFEQDGTQYHLSDINEVQENLKAFNLQTYQDILNQHDNGCFFCANWPYYYDEQIKARWLNDLTLETYEDDLHQQQCIDLYYANPTFYNMNKDGQAQIMGIYTITATVDTIFPLQPKVPFRYLDFETAEETKADFYVVCLYSIEDDKVLSTISFDDFIIALNQRELHEHDSEYVYFNGLSEKELKEIAKQYLSVIEV